MNARAWTVATGLCLASLLGCSEEGHTPAAATPTVSVVASPTSVVADGVNTVTLTVTDSGSGPVAVTTNRGTFTTGGTTATVAGASGALTLRTCDAGTDGTCAGTATVTATSQATGATGSASITFGSLAALCPSNCAADDGCAGLACNRTGGGTGTCSASTPSSCLVTGCTPTASSETSCTGGVDEDCDGLVDCNDGSCAGNAACGTSTPLPALGSLQIPEPAAEHAAMGAKDSGWNELGAVMVQALDATGKPYPDGLTVTFTHRPLGGSTLVGGTLASGVVTYDAVTEGGEGVAIAYLRSGTAAGTLLVTATATGGGVTRTATLPTVAVVGAKASGANFSVVCNPRNVPALAETDCSVSLVDAPFTCAAILKDRFGNVLGRPTQVVFQSEASSVGPIATTPAYADGEDPTSQDGLGIAVQLFQTLGNGLPFDVAGDGVEPVVTHGLDRCGVRDHNPRDGVVTIVAVADGEEAFFDTNGNGGYDAGEPFVDQGEPFVDQDDDGVRDADERFLDLDGDGYDPPNDAWDAQTKVWTQTVVVYTGKPSLLGTSTPAFLGTRWVDAADFAGACEETDAPTPFALVAKGAGDPPTAPTSAEYVVVASDWNLNVLAQETTYAVAPKDDAKVKVGYDGYDKYADEVGFMYQYWPCDQTGGSCASQCRVTGANAPCVMKPAIGDYSCGVAADVKITGGDEADLGPVVVEWTVNTPWFVYENSKFVEAILPLGGTVTAP